MLTLIKKDCRVNAVAIVGSAILQTMMYVVIAVIGLVAMWYDKVDRSDVIDGLMTASLGGLAIMALMAAVYGGGAFALERRERSGDFIGILPIKRWRIIASKLLVAAVGLLIIWAINVAVLLFAGPGTVHGGPLFERARIVWFISAIALMAFGLGWMFSTFLSSASLAAAISITMTLAMMITVQMIETYTYLGLSSDSGTSLITQIAVWTGLVSLVVGTIYYLRRVEP